MFEVFGDPSGDSGMHKVREGSRMEKAPKAKVGFLLGFKGGSFEDF